MDLLIQKVADRMDEKRGAGHGHLIKRDIWQLNEGHLIYSLSTAAISRRDHRYTHPFLFLSSR
jgi:hypothetical protein